MPTNDHGAFHAIDPFFSVVTEGLWNYVTDERYFDTLPDDVISEFRYEFPGWPEVIRGRAQLMQLV